jgi:hypothetical protein
VTTKASQITIHGEASTLLPFIYAALSAPTKNKQE